MNSHVGGKDSIEEIIDLFFMPWQNQYDENILNLAFIFVISIIIFSLILFVLIKKEKISLIQYVNLLIYVWFIIGSIFMCISFYWFVSIPFIIVELMLLRKYIKSGLKTFISEEAKGIVGWSQQERDLQKQIFESKSTEEQKRILENYRPKSTVFYNINLILFVTILIASNVGTIIAICYMSNNTYKFFP